MAANVIFAQRFSSSAEPTTAFGTNLLGRCSAAALSHGLETGYRMLLVFCAALHLGAFLLTPHGAARGLNPTASTPLIADPA
jgi:hypothetical protein